MQSWVASPPHHFGVIAASRTRSGMQDRFNLSYSLVPGWSGKLYTGRPATVKLTRTTSAA